MAHGLALAVMISCVGHISGAHFNPAVTTGFLVTGRMSAGEWAVYIVSQLLGATLAALLLLALVPGATGTNPPLGGQALALGVGFGAGVGIEIILTFFLVFTVFATAVDERGAFKMIAGFGIGLALALNAHDIV